MTSEPPLGPVFGEHERQHETVPYQDTEELAEHEIRERAREDREVEYLDPEDNEAHAAGEVCARCGKVIAAREDARLVGEGQWIHEVCP